MRLRRLPGRENTDYVLDTTTEYPDDNTADTSDGLAPENKRRRIAKKDPAKKKEFRFLDLPGGVRNMIYQEALVHDGELSIRRRSYNTSLRDLWDEQLRGTVVVPDPRDKKSRIRANYGAHYAANLLLVNRQVYLESVGYVWSNKFCVSPENVSSWLAPPRAPAKLPKAAGFLRELETWVQANTRAKHLVHLADAVGAKQLRHLLLNAPVRCLAPVEEIASDLDFMLGPLLGKLDTDARVTLLKALRLRNSIYFAEENKRMREALRPILFERWTGREMEANSDRI